MCRLWYVSEELAPLTLKTNEVNNNTNWKWKLQKTRFWLWKTRFYKMLVICNCFRWPISIKQNDSWSFFRIIGVYDRFFNTPVTQWQANDAYQLGKLNVAITHVANNYAEHKVKPCQDFNGSTEKEKHFQCIVQVAENSHHTSKSWSWFLVP